MDPIESEMRCRLANNRPALAYVPDICRWIKYWKLNGFSYTPDGMKEQTVKFMNEFEAFDIESAAAGQPPNLDTLESMAEIMLEAQCYVESINMFLICLSGDVKIEDPHTTGISCYYISYSIVKLYESRNPNWAHLKEKGLFWMSRFLAHVNLSRLLPFQKYIPLIQISVAIADVYTMTGDRNGRAKAAHVIHHVAALLDLLSEMLCPSKVNLLCNLVNDNVSTPKFCEYLDYYGYRSWSI